MKKMKMWKIGLAIVALVALATAAVGFVAAQSDEAVPGKGRIGDFLSRLADNLGITQEELEGAIDQTQLELLDEAVADGRVSEDKAAKIRERIESSEGGFGPFGRGFKGGFAHGYRLGHLGAGAEDLAEFLGISVEDLRAALADGQSPAQVAEANGSSAEQLSAYLLGELETRLAEAVANGKVDQARADEVLANAAEKIDRFINHDWSPGFRQFPGRFAPNGTPEAELEETGTTL